MDHIDTYKIVESSNVDEVNNLLGEGWFIIKTYTTCHPECPDNQTLIYSLGISAFEELLRNEGVKATDAFNPSDQD